MPRQTLFDIHKNYREWMSDVALNSFEKLMHDDIGTVIKKSHSREIRRIESCGRTVYLKRRLQPQPRRRSLEMYLRGMRAHSIPYIEYLHVLSLQRCEMPVMNVIAAGEDRRCGFPRRGFILCDEVKGFPLDELVKNASDTEDRDCLLRTYGRLLAKLHKHGFFAPVRLKDVVTADQEGRSPILIDREARYPYPRRCLKQKARRKLNDGFRRIARETPSFDQHQQGVVMQAYHDYLAQNGHAQTA